MTTSDFELGTDGPSRIMVGLDGSETSLRAAAYAAGLARRQDTELVVVYVASTTTMSAGLAATAGSMVEVHDALARELRELVVTGAKTYGLRSRFIVRHGNPYKELVAVAHELRVDALVVGASTQAGHKLVGSLAGRLVKDAAWPVTVVP